MAGKKEKHMGNYPNLTKLKIRPILIAVLDFMIITAISSMVVFG